jgi:transposase
MDKMNISKDVPTTVINERLDDYVLILNVVMQSQLPQIVDSVLTMYCGTNKISWGWLLTIWLTYILSTADHCKLHVLKWAKSNLTTLEKITGLTISINNFTDDHLGILLMHVSNVDFWEKIEVELTQKTIAIYDLSADTIRVDATTASGYHAETSDGLFQFGHAKENPGLRQTKIMIAALDPIGYPVATHTVSGEKSDDVLYLDIILQAVKTLEKKGILFVGDCKMTAYETRLAIERMHQYYLGPLAMVGSNKELSDNLINICIENPTQMQNIFVPDEKETGHLYAQGYETNRHYTDNEKIWTERIFVCKSIRYNESERISLNKNIEKARIKLLELTPARGKGVKQITEESQLAEKIDAIIKKHQVRGLLTVNFEREETHIEKYIGKGRGGKDREIKELVTVRYQITAVELNIEAIAYAKERLGWRIFVTNAPEGKISLIEGTLIYRNEWIIEHGFSRMKGAELQLVPMYMKNDDQIKGLSHLISLGVRYLSTIEFIVRRSLKKNNEKLSDLHAENKQKKTDAPTSERLLKAMYGITITKIIKGDNVEQYITSLTSVQKRIIELMGFTVSIYESLI